MGQDNKNQQYEGQYSNINRSAQCCINDQDILQKVQVWIKHRYLAALKTYSIIWQDRIQF
jgi:hypothetical protein